MTALTRSLRRLRRRFTAQSFCEKLAVCALAGGGFFVLGVQTLAGKTGLHVAFSCLLAAGTVLAAALWTWATRLSLKKTAARIDALAPTRDRFSSALAFAQLPAPTEWQAAALEECARFIGAFQARPFTRWRLPRAVPWLLVPIVAGTLLFWHAQFSRDRPRADSTARQELAEKADALEKLTRQIEATNAPAESAELKKIADEMRKSIAHLRDPAAEKMDANKTALSELSALQDALEKMRDGGAAKLDLAALAEALQKARETKRAADSLRAGDLNAAADALEKLSDQAAQIAQNMPQSSESPSELAKAMSELARAAGSSERARPALQKLAQTLRRSAGSQAREGAGSQTLQAVLNALQEIKFGQAARSLATPGNSLSEPAEAKTVVQSFAKANAHSPNLESPDTGRIPGSEYDRGTTKTPFGAEQKRSDESPAALDLAGAIGAGGSLQKLITTQGDASKSAQRYRQLYDAMAPAAEEAVQQENIPLGSRFFVKRYFESIRPAE